MSEFVYQLESREEEDGILIFIYLLNEKGEKLRYEEKIAYRLVIEKEKFEKLGIETQSVKIIEGEFKNKKGEELALLEIWSKEVFEYIKRLVKEAGFTIYEGDLNDELRLMIDYKLKIIKGEKFIGDKIPRIAIDIETIGEVEDQRIVLISCDDGRLDNNSKNSKVFMNASAFTKDGLKNVEKEKFKDFELIVLKDEKELLETFREFILDLNPAIIIGWNVIDFDFKVIRDRMRANNVLFSFSKDSNECNLRIYSEFFKASTMSCPGVLVWDLIAILKTNFILFDDYKLETVAREVLSDSKINIDEDELPAGEEGIADKIRAIENMLKKNPRKLIEYNFKDSRLCNQIIDSLKLTELMTQRSVMTNTPFQKVKSPIATLDIMYLRELHKRGIIAESNFNFTDTSPIEGAYVIEPVKSFENDVFVLDFKSLYPSIIMTFNIDPYTSINSSQNFDFANEDFNSFIKAPNGKFFLRERGILPEIIENLFSEREEAKKKGDKIRSFAIKTTMNSFYGALAAPRSRFYDKEVAEAITGFGREIIQEARRYFETGNIARVIYGDTDSIFVKANCEFKNLDEKKKFGYEIQDELNKHFSKWVFENFGCESRLVIELEKIFSSFFIASKKRYVGFDELSSKMVYVGMEAIRGDWTELARRFQRELVDLIFSGKKKEEIEGFIKEYIEKLRRGEFDNLLIYTKRITKPLEKYTKTTPPHVKAARELESFSGRKVEYYILKSGPKHKKLMPTSPDYDYEHYIQKQLKGVSDDLLEVFGIDFETITSGEKQGNLNKFF